MSGMHTVGLRVTAMHLCNAVTTGHHDMSLESAQIVIHWSLYTPELARNRLS